MTRTPKERERRDGRGRIVSSIKGWSGGLFPCGPHARRMQRKHHAFMRGWNAWEYRCYHHLDRPSPCRERKRVLKRAWWDGVREAQETGLYGDAYYGEGYCECECAECIEHYYREFPGEESR